MRAVFIAPAAAVIDLFIYTQKFCIMISDEKKKKFMIDEHENKERETKKSNIK